MPDLAKKILFFKLYLIFVCSIYRLAMCNVCSDINFGIEDMHMCPKNCIECALYDACILCRDSLSGTTCRASCRKNCLTVILPNGALLKACSRVKRGKRCCIMCVGYTFCSDCSAFSGSCLNCSTGTYGILTNCDKKCGHCQPDAEGVVNCDIYTGDCNGACQDGYFGQRCDQACNKYCLDLATNFTKCDKLSGNCTSGCVSGRYDDTCAQTCSSNCYGNVCNKNSGDCTAGCIPGWHGVSCETTCSNLCANGKCNQTTGYCEHECEHGWYGDMCEKSCSDTCLNRSCGHLSGICENGCAVGNFGDYCESRCSDTCVSRMCDNHTAQCVLGCRPGFEGNYCNKSSINLKASAFYHQPAFLVATCIAAGAIITFICTFGIRFIQKNVDYRGGYGVSERLSGYLPDTTEPIYEEINDGIGSEADRQVQIELCADQVRVQGSSVSSNIDSVDSPTFRQNTSGDITTRNEKTLDYTDIIEVENVESHTNIQRLI